MSLGGHTLASVNKIQSKTKPNINTVGKQRSSAAPLGALSQCMCSRERWCGCTKGRQMCADHQSGVSCEGKQCFLLTGGGSATKAVEGKVKNNTVEIIGSRA